MTEYDIIIVGAGPGGATAAKCAVEKGFKTLLIERSQVPGQKNCSGTALSPKVFRDFRYLEPDLGMESVRIAKMATAHLIDDDLEERTLFGFSPSNHATYPEAREFLTVNVYRAELDPYLADLALIAGAELKTSTTIIDLIRNDKNQIIGVIDDAQNKYYGRIVLGADGVISTVALKSGLRHRWNPDELTLMVTIDFEAPKAQIDKVFGSNALHYWFSSAFPVAYSFFHGTGVHVGLGHFINAWDKKPQHYLNKLLQIPALKRQLDLVQARPREYQAHLLTFVKEPVRTYSPSGILLIGDAAGFPCPLEAEGIYYAMLSGQIAIDVCEQYLTSDDPSVLKTYEQRWQESPIGEEFELGLEIFHFIREIPFSMDAAKWLIPFVNDLLYLLLNVGESHPHNLANLLPNLHPYYKYLPTLLKSTTPAITPIIEHIIQEWITNSLAKVLPESINSLMQDTFGNWKRIRRKLTELFYKFLMKSHK
ncbi:MAG: NAD(P)/FAD-dependent oxidoreductase [Candidatus Helarchaeota archaeon]